MNMLATLKFIAGFCVIFAITTKLFPHNKKRIALSFIESAGITLAGVVIANDLVDQRYLEVLAYIAGGLAGLMAMLMLLARVHAATSEDRSSAEVRDE